MLCKQQKSCAPRKKKPARWRAGVGRWWLPHLQLRPGRVSKVADRRARPSRLRCGERCTTCAQGLRSSGIVPVATITTEGCSHQAASNAVGPEEISAALTRLQPSCVMVMVAGADLRHPVLSLHWWATTPRTPVQRRAITPRSAMGTSASACASTITTAPGLNRQPRRAALSGNHCLGATHLSPLGFSSYAAPGACVMAPVSPGCLEVP